MSFLETIPKPISVITVVGEERSGKSFILNRLARQISAFKVSHNSSVCTKGICIYNKAIPIILDDGSLVNILLVDTEGLDYGSGEDQKHGENILQLATLISSHLIYNTKC